MMDEHVVTMMMVMREDDAMGIYFPSGKREEERERASYTYWLMT